MKRKRKPINYNHVVKFLIKMTKPLLNFAIFFISFSFGYGLLALLLSTLFVLFGVEHMLSLFWGVIVGILVYIFYIISLPSPVSMFYLAIPFSLTISAHIKLVWLETQMEIELDGIDYKLSEVRGDIVRMTPMDNRFRTFIPILTLEQKKDYEKLKDDFLKAEQESKELRKDIHDEFSNR